MRHVRRVILCRYRIKFLNGIYAELMTGESLLQWVFIPCLRMIPFGLPQWILINHHGEEMSVRRFRFSKSFVCLSRASVHVQGTELIFGSSLTSRFQRK